MQWHRARPCLSADAVLTIADAVRLSAVVGPTTFARGRAYAAGGAVIARTDEVEGVVVGTVQGSQAEPYDPVIRLRRDADRRLSKIEGDCTCPVGWNCKHCVAVLLSPADRDGNAAANLASLVESVESIGTASGAGTGRGSALANAQREERFMGSPRCSSANYEDGTSFELDKTVTATRQQVAPRPVPVASDR